MISHLTINLNSDVSEPISTFLRDKNKELIISDIIFYDSKKIVYKARLRKSDFIDNIDKILLEEKQIKEKYGVRYFEILNSDSTLKMYSILIIQKMPHLAEKLLSTFSDSVFIIPPLILNDWGLKVNLLAISGFLESIRNFLQENTIKYEVVKIGNLDFGSKILSEREQIIIKRAYDSGYFELPRRNNLENLSDSLGITKSTFMRILRKAENKIIKIYLEEVGLEL
ncbi:MAG: helix-turn-helix domain-containing protein [Thermoplasmata archaeon]